MKKIILFGVLLFCSLPSTFADEIEDGEHDAIVRTESGSYSVPVEVEDGEVTRVHWPNGGDMHVYGADIDDGEAQGRDSRGDRVTIELEE